MPTREFLESRRFANVVLAVIAILLAVIIWTQVSPAIEAVEGVTITYHPEVGTVCLSGKTLICDHWQKFVEKGMYDNRTDAWNSIFGATH